MAGAQQEQSRRRQIPSGSGTVPILGDTREIALVGRVGGVKTPDVSKAPKKPSSTLTRSNWENDGRETGTFPPFSYPAETLLIGTAIVILNKEETPPGKTSRADRLGVRLHNNELAWLLWSGKKFREEHNVGEAELETAQRYLLQSIRYLETHRETRQAMAEIAIPADPEHSFKERVLSIVGKLNIAQLDDLLKVVLEESLPIRRRPSINFAMHPWIAR